MKLQLRTRCCTLIVLLLCLSPAFSANCKLDQKSGHVDCSGQGLTQFPSNLPTWSRFVDLSVNKITGVPVLRNLPNLVELDLSRNRIVSNGIAKNAFLNCTPQSLDLSFNSLTTVPVLALPNRPKLWRLNLAYNKLGYLLSNSFASFANVSTMRLNVSRTLSRVSQSPIDVEAFLPLAKSLEILDLSYNALTLPHFNKGLRPLVKSKKLGQLSISGSRIPSLKRGFLQKFPNVSTLFLAQSGLQTVDDDAFTDLHILDLNLRSNSIKSLSPKVFSSLNLMQIFLGKNPFDCTCNLAWLHYWLPKVASSDKNDVRCSTPKKLNNSRVVDWDASGCLTSTPKPPTTTTHQPTTTTHKPTTTTHKPTTTTHKPTTTTHKPTTTTHKPTTTTHKPTTTTTHNPNATTTHHPTTSPHSTAAPSSGHGGFPWWGALLIVIGVTLLALLIYVLVRRARRSRLDESTMPIVRDEDEGVTTRRAFLC